MRDHSEKKSNSEFLNTEKGKTKSNAIEVPYISLPKGGVATNEWGELENVVD